MRSADEISFKTYRGSFSAPTKPVVAIFRFCRVFAAQLEKRKAGQEPSGRLHGRVEEIQPVGKGERPRFSWQIATQGSTTVFDRPGNLKFLRGTLTSGDYLRFPKNRIRRSVYSRNFKDSRALSTSSWRTWTPFRRVPSRSLECGRPCAKE